MIDRDVFARGSLVDKADLDEQSLRTAAIQKQLLDLQAELVETRGLLNDALEREAGFKNELQHRIRNTLAVIRSIFSRTAETYTSVQSLADHFGGRLDAVARHHAGSLGLNRRRIEVEDMVRDELLLIGADVDTRISLTGPDCALGARDAESFGLALHELMTNSIKFGVLSGPNRNGRLNIEWSLSPGRMTFRWVEKGMPVLSSAPLNYGFGREFIEQSLPYQHDARTSFDLGPGTLTCIIDLPALDAE